MSALKKITKYFGYRPEEGQNPYIGIMSFQHFRGEALYSDMVVKQGGDMTETEHVECYPIPEYVPQNGREEGYYPDSSIVYIRVLWKEFEPEFGVFNYDFIEDIIKKAREHNQSLVFRLMPHSTRACDDVPDWLREMIPCPERPEGKRVKDSPTAPEFLKYFTRAIRKLGERFDGEKGFEYIDISLVGSWGEGSGRENFPPEDIDNLVNTYSEVFKKTRLIGQLSDTDRLISLNKKTAVGWRGDGLGDPFHINEYYPPFIAKVPDIWKTVPVSFESYWWLGEWKRLGWDIDNIIEKTLEWHISSFNPKSLPIPFEWQDKIEYWLSKMGYHYAPGFVKFSESLKPGEKTEVEICMENHGVAPLYKELPFAVRLVGEGEDIMFTTDEDVRKWLPGKHELSIELTVPETLKTGVYDLEIGIIDEDFPCVYMCTDAERDGKFYKVGKMKVEA